MLDDETFAVDVGKVYEVLEPVPITRVPRSPEFLLGVINLRGSVVPVVDLRRRFGLSPRQVMPRSCIVVVEVEQEGESLVIGLLADAVQEVVSIEVEKIDPTPRLGMGLHTDYLEAMVRLGDLFVLLINLDRLFRDDDLTIAATGMNPPEAVSPAVAAM
jgi:purine-binding chemotaxis protein CheW